MVGFVYHCNTVTAGLTQKCVTVLVAKCVRSALKVGAQLNEIKICTDLGNKYQPIHITST